MTRKTIYMEDVWLKVILKKDNVLHYFSCQNAHVVQTIKRVCSTKRSKELLTHNDGIFGNMLEESSNPLH